MIFLGGIYMFYDDKLLREISGIYDFQNLEEIYEDLVEELVGATETISHEVYGTSLSNEPITIGSFVSHTNSNSAATLDFLILSSNLSIIDNDLSYVKSKNKRQKEELLTTAKIRLQYMDALLGSFTSATQFYVLPNSLFIESVYEIGFNINIYVGVEKNGVVHFLDAINNRIVKFNYDKYYNLLEKKNDKTLGQYKRIVNMVQNLFYNCEVYLSNYVVESLFYNVPNELFKGPYSEQIIKIINYLNIIDFRDFKSIDSNDKLINNAFLNTNYYTLKTSIARLVESLR